MLRHIIKRAYFKDKENFNRAVEDYIRAISIDPKISITDEKTIVLYILSIDDYKVQVDYLNKLLKLNPNSSAFYNSCGWAYENYNAPRNLDKKNDENKLG